MKALFRITKKKKITATPGDFQPLRAKRSFGWESSCKQPQGPEKSPKRL